MPRHRLLLLLALPAMLAGRPARADCELLYAPPDIRTRLLAFHHANEQRRAEEHAKSATADAAPARGDRHAQPKRPLRGEKTSR